MASKTFKEMNTLKQGMVIGALAMVMIFGQDLRNAIMSNGNGGNTDERLIMVEMDNKEQTERLSEGSRIQAQIVVQVANLTGIIDKMQAREFARLESR